MGKGARILVVDDDASTRELIKRSLGKYIPSASVLTLASGDSLLETAFLYKPNLVILDWVLGHGRTGVGLCRQLKLNPATKKISVLLISGKKLSENDELKSVAQGSDAYLVKPFAMRALAEKSKALIKRASLDRDDDGQVLREGSLLLNRKERRVFGCRGGWRRLPEKLFNLLWFLAKRYPKAVPTQRLIRYVWRNEVRDAEAAVAISRLKKYLDPKTCALEWAPGQGYRLRVF